MVPVRGAQRFLDAVPGSRLELLDTCGHCPQIEDPERFTELVLQFGADVADATGASPAAAR
jgi:pimeloyl-ACP methyl ester carboxylesterase